MIKKFGDMTPAEQVSEMSELMQFINLMLPGDAFPVLMLVAVQNKDGKGGTVISAVNCNRQMLIECMEKILEQIKAAQL